MVSYQEAEEELLCKTFDETARLKTISTCNEYETKMETEIQYLFSNPARVFQSGFVNVHIQSRT